MITLPYLTPLPNEWQRLHFRTKRRKLQQIAASLALSHPQAVQKPLSRARVRIVRNSSVKPDPDAIKFCKPILDAMQPPSKRHPYGVGFIADDSSQVIDLSCDWVYASPMNGSIVITVEPIE